MKKYFFIIPLLLIASVAHAAFPNTPILETFTGTNGTSPPNSNWTNSGSNGLQIQSNQAAQVTPNSANAKAYWNLANFGPNMEAYVTLSSKGDNVDPASIYFKYDVSTSNGYRLRCISPSSSVQLLRYDSGVGTQLGATISQAVNSADSFGAAYTSGVAEIFYKVGAAAWGSLGTRSDSTYASQSARTMLEIWNFDGVARMDDFGGGTVNFPLYRGVGMGIGRGIQR